MVASSSVFAPAARGSTAHEPIAYACAAGCASPGSCVSGTKLARIRPCANNSASHIASLTSVLRHGKPEAVVLGFADWERLSRVPSFGRLLMSAPVEPADLPERNHSPMRDTSL